MTTLNREQILGAPDLQFQNLDVPEWGGQVRIRQLSMLDVEHINSSTNNNTRKMALAVALSIVDDDGKQLFTMEDADGILGHSAPAINRLSAAVATLNGWTVAASGDLEKNSESAPTGASSSS